MQSPSEVQAIRDSRLTVRETLSSKREELHRESDAKFAEAIDDSDDDEHNFDARMRQQIINKRKELGDQPTKRKLHKGRSILCMLFDV